MSRAFEKVSTSTQSLKRPSANSSSNDFFDWHIFQQKKKQNQVTSNAIWIKLQCVSVNKKKNADDLIRTKMHPVLLNTHYILGWRI